MTGRDVTLATSEATRPCVGTDTELWFGPADDTPLQLRESYAEQLFRERTAKGLCAGCPFVVACLESELTFGIEEQWGVRGGMTGKERKQLLRDRRAAARRVFTAERAVA